MTRSLLILGLAASAILPASADPGPAGWINLLDGAGLGAWTKADGKPVPSGGWVLDEGVLHKKEQGAGDIFTAAEYGDFELTLEWKISPTGNSGIKYRVAQYGKSWLGPEYQVLDDATHPDGRNGADRLSAALYYLKAADPEAKKLHPVGEWNTTRIVAKGRHFQHYLNGALVVDITVGSDEWKAALAKSKFKNIPGFAENPRGRIMLQDHGDPVWFRNIRIREL